MPLDISRCVWLTEEVHSPHLAPACFGGFHVPRLLLRCTALALSLAGFCTVPMNLAQGSEEEIELPPAVEREVDFADDVQPILVKHCYSCHGPEKQESELRLDRKQNALEGGISGAVIEVGNSGESLLIELVAGIDPNMVMPPEGERLTPEQIGLLRAWIDQGARWSESENGENGNEPVVGSDHWSFQPVRRPAVPEVENQVWVRNPIDAFGLAKLESEGIDPAPEADRSTLIRRLGLDLLGLPPTPEEVEAFLGDTSPDAYERLVDRLLDSPHFGERWTRHWLDLARYADSDGYEKDRPRPYAWRYRNWVIDAINRDLPFDQFTLEQLAGDLLPGATLDQKVATGFHRNTLTNREGGVDQEEDRVKIAVDRVNTTGTVWLGLTIGCTQCHSHKFDPLTQREFYGMYAFFNSTDEADIPAPLPAELAGHEQRKKAYDAEHAPLVASVEAYRKKHLSSRQAAWEQALGQSSEVRKGWQALTPVSYSSAGGASVSKLDDDSLLFGGQNPTTDEYTLVVNTALKGITALRLQVLPHDSLPKKGPGRAENGNFVLSEIGLTAAPLGEPANAIPVPLRNATSDFEQKDFGIAGAVDGKADTGWAVGQGGTARTAIFRTGLSVGYETGATLKITLKQLHGNKHQLGRLRLSATTVSRDEIDRLPSDATASILAVAKEKRTDEQNADLASYYAAIDPGLVQLKQVVAEHAKKEPPYPATQAQTLSERNEPRNTFIHIRGDFLRKGAAVQPHVPAVLASFKPRASRPDRLDLARWIVDAENPLTSRVAANRIWQYLFGRGLVTTPEDFGTRGELPTHPALLDWLATEYLQRGWSRKAMIRLIVQSATYRQSSRLRPELLDRDPNNALLARQNRYRLSAEIVRDSYLRAAGLLNPTIGGPSIRPPLPADVAALGYANSVKWKESEGADRYRRGLYIFFQRTVPYPMLSTFDAPDSNITCARRERSNTPLQALTLLNDPVFFECAQVLASRVLQEKQGTTEQRLRYAFGVCLARQPSEGELAQLTEYFADLVELARTDLKAAETLAGPVKNSDVNSAEAAAWVAVSRTILNLDELVTRE